MRDVKFRAKGLDSTDWCYGIMHNDGVNLFPVSVDMNTIGQFTGLTDKNGKEIYEGDVLQSVEYKDIKHIVVYDEHYASFMALCIDENMGTPLESKCHITQKWIFDYPKEVIGNVIDNKQLLEG